MFHNLNTQRNILVYTRTYGAPSEVWIRRQVSSLKRYRPTVCCLRAFGDNAERLEIISLRKGGLITHRLRQIGCLFIECCWPGSHTVYAWSMARKAKQKKASLIHCHFLWNAPLAVKTGHFANVPVICTAHGTDVNTAMVNEAYRMQLQKHVFPYITCIIAVSQFIARQLIEIGCPRHKIEMLHIGAPLPGRYFQSGIKNKLLRIVCVASFAPVKGHLDLLAAFRKALDSAPEMRLTLVGDGPERALIERCIAERSLKDCVQLAGWLSPDDVQQKLQEADIYAQASYRYEKPDGQVVSEEGLPISMVEAACHGLPIIGTDSGGISEICRNGANGFLVPERDINAMAEALVKLALNKDMRHDMGRKSREIAEQDFDADIQVGKLEELYDILLSNKKLREPL